jgi:hypothetical protein
MMCPRLPLFQQIQGMALASNPLLTPEYHKMDRRKGKVEARLLAKVHAGQSNLRMILSVDCISEDKEELLKKSGLQVLRRLGGVVPGYVVQGDLSCILQVLRSCI